MDAVSASMMVLMLIFELGLSGASYNTCKDTLSSNGYSLTDSQYQSFYEAANDPGNLHYISTHQSELSEQWTIASSSDNTSVVDWYVNNINAEDSIAYDNPVDSKWVENSSTSSSVSFSKQDIENMFFQQYGKVGKVITDGHDGYYIGEFVPSDNNPSSPGSYRIVHYNADGSSRIIQQIGLPYLNDEVRNGYAAFEVDYSVVENEDGSQTVTAYRFSKQVNPDLPSGFSINQSDYPFVVRFPNAGTEPVAEVKGDEITLPVNPDGTVTLPDGTVLVPNEDGSFTIGGVDYFPKPDVLSPTDLLKQLLELQKKIKDLEDQLQFEKEKDKELDEAIDEAVDEAIDSYDGNLSEFLLNSRITQVFPFCLPFDFVRGIKLFSTSPVAPKFDIDFDIPAFGSYPGTHNVITLDLAPYSKYFVVVRWITTVIFIVSLTLVTSKLIKW